MGLIRAAVGAIGGTLADQWKDFLTVPDNLAPTAALFAAEPQGRNAGRGSNTKASDNIITNGSRIIVPEGYGLILLEQGAVTGFAAEAGAYEWNSDDPNSQSVFAGDGIVSPLIKQSWERFKFGGQPGAQQRAYFVTLKELPNNRFGTQSEIYWDDAYMNAQVGAVTRGTYTLKVTDPILFLKAWVPAAYLEPGRGVRLHRHRQRRGHTIVQRGRRVARTGILDVHERSGQRQQDHQDPTGLDRVRPEPVGCSGTELSVAHRAWPRDRRHRDHLDRIRRETRELLRNVQRADALSGARGNSNLQASVAAGFESAGENTGAAGLVGLGIASGATGLGGLQQPVPGIGAQSSPPPPPPPAAGAAGAGPAPAAPAAPAADDPMAQLTKFKEMLDAGLITQDDYDAAKNKVLGL